MKKYPVPPETGKELTFVQFSLGLPQILQVQNHIHWKFTKQSWDCSPFAFHPGMIVPAFICLQLTEFFTWFITEG